MSVKSLSELRKSRGGFESLLKEVKKLESKGERKEDDRFWKPTVDKAGNGYAVIRFLPAPANEDLAWVQLWSHGFQGPTGKWYIEDSLTTIGKQDPVSDLNTKLWNSGRESDKEIARKQKRKLSYIANILVVEDKANPENEGKVFLFKFGTKIFDKIKDSMQPQFEDETPVNPFDFWDGANFKLKIRKVEGYQNYDKSEFDKQTPVAKTDEEIEKIWKQQHSLQEFVNPARFKTYEELQEKLNRVLNDSSTVGKAEDYEMEAAVAKSEREVSQRKMASKPSKIEDEDEDDESLSYFEKLAEQ